jgi:hypothetical protein
MIVAWDKYGLKAYLSALLVLGMSSPHREEFTRRLPSGVPSPVGWERIAGEAHLGNPPLSVWYEFYVNPERPALYQIVRYRIESAKPDDDYRAFERLQWHLSGTKTLRRFECRETRAYLDEATPCEWRELLPESAEYRRETAVILWLYGLHRSLLEVRERGS